MNHFFIQFKKNKNKIKTTYLAKKNAKYKSSKQNCKQNKTLLSRARSRETKITKNELSKQKPFQNGNKKIGLYVTS